MTRCRLPLTILLSLALSLGGPPAGAQVWRVEGAPLATLDPLRATLDQAGLEVQQAVRDGSIPNKVQELVRAWGDAQDELGRFTDEIVADLDARTTARQVSEAELAAWDAAYGREAQSQRIVIQTSMTVADWARVQVDGPGEVVINDAVDAAHAKLEDITRRQDELDAAYRDAQTSAERADLRRQMAENRRELSKTVDGIGKMVEAVAVPVEKKLEKAVGKDMRRLLADCPKHLMNATEALSVAEADLARCVAASPNGQCPQLEGPFYAAQRQYEAVDMQCSTLERRIDAANKPKVVTAQTNGEAAVAAAKTDPTKAAQAGVKAAQEAAKAAKDKPANDDDDDFLVPLVHTPPSKTPPAKVEAAPPPPPKPTAAEDDDFLVPLTPPKPSK
jgi:hypothetical protein